MNYFDLFDLPVVINVDKSALKRKFYNLSRKYHPDNYTLESEDIQFENTKKYSEITKGYESLLDKQKRIGHILDILGIDKNAQLPPIFLMEMMELNEELDEIGDGKKDSFIEKIEHLSKSLEEEIKKISNFNFLESDNKTNKIILQEYFLKRQYLLQINKKL